MSSRLAIILGLLPAALAWGAAADPNPYNIDFSGHWELDYRLSDRANDKTARLRDQARADYEDALLRARAGFRVPRGSLANNHETVIGLGWLAEKITQATVLDIQQEEDHIVVGRNDDFALVCEFNAPQPVSSPFGVEACGWDKNQLTFQINLADGLRIHHRLSLGAGSKRLNLATTVQVTGLPYPITLNRVYMPYEPGEGLYHCEYSLARKTTCSLVGKGKE